MRPFTLGVTLFAMTASVAAQELPQQGLLEFPELELGCGQTIEHRGGVADNSSSTPAQRQSVSPTHWRRRPQALRVTSLPPAFLPKSRLSTSAIAGPDQAVTGPTTGRVRTVIPAPPVQDEPSPEGRENDNPDDPWAFGYGNPPPLATPEDPEPVATRGQVTTALPDWYVFQQAVQSAAAPTGQRSSATATRAAVPPIATPTVRRVVPASSSSRSRAFRYIRRGRCGG